MEKHVVLTEVEIAKVFTDWEIRRRRMTADEQRDRDRECETLSVEASGWKHAAQFLCDVIRTRGEH